MPKGESMPLPYKIETMDSVDPVFHKEYSKSDSGGYLLNVEGLPKAEEPPELKSALQKERDARKAAEKLIKEKEAEAKTKELEAAKASGDVQALEKSWTDKLNTEKQTYEQQLQSLNGMINNLTVGSTATKLAAELAVQGSADVLLPHIQNRLKVEVVDGNPVVRVLDREGKPSAATVEELKSEFLNNQSFAPIISGTKASGAGHRGAGNSGGAAEDSMMKLSPVQRMIAARAAKK